ncbi:MAG: sugar ABC transporter ATP-binding protein, partial [Anaerolineae bacterium]
HALVGENGAGKSTLIKIFGGLLQPTSGTILLNGQPVHFDNPLQSQEAGISVITQEFNLVPQLTVAENIFLGREPRRAGLLDRRTIVERCNQVLQELGSSVPLHQRVEYLSVGDRQLVEIAKALSREFRIIIMDEPTAALNAGEVERLFTIIANLRQRGIAVLYVSHRLNEIFRIADRVTVLRDGRKVGTRLIRETNDDEVITMMLGHALEQYAISHTPPTSQQRTPILSVRNLRVPAALYGVSFDLYPGEVLSIAGLVGSGRSELMRVLGGITSPTGGEISVNGNRVVLKNPTDAQRYGIFFLPEDRKVEGLFPHLTVLENLVINARSEQRDGPGLFLKLREEENHYQRVQQALAIRARSHTQLISSLSGGNQQKVLLGRALVSGSRILLLNEPTRGVDVGTKVEIHEIIRQLAKEGRAVLVSSSDVPEIVHVSDRCLVLSAGQVAAVLEGDQISEEKILAAAVGHTAKEGGH